MAYTNNVPQANQQISQTQAPIQANFSFLQTGIGTEHNFVPTGSGSNMFHLQASMPNIGTDPVTVPAGTAGLYYVNNGNARFLSQGGTLCRLSEGSNTSGYQWISRSLLQWGFLNAGTGNQTVTITFPIPFPTAVSALIMTGSSSKILGTDLTLTAKATSTPLVSFQVFQHTSSGDVTGFSWLAVGF